MTTTAAPWTRWYWPAAVTVSVAGFITATLTRYEGWALLLGAVLLGAPELWFLIRRQWASTLSDWTWHILGVTRTQHISQWKVQHLLAFLAYLALAARAVWALLPYGWWPVAGSAVLAVWLTWHLFFRWWR